MYNSNANGDIFCESSPSHGNNNIEDANCLLTRKRKSRNATSAKQKKNKISGNMHSNLSTIMQSPSNTTGKLQNTEGLITSIPVDISNIILKQEKSDGIITAVSDDQYQIYLLES